jgi:hypothetical protein
MTKKNTITMSAAVEQALTEVNGPLAMDEFIRRILTIYPSKAKKPAASIRTHLRYDHEGKTLVYLDRQTIVPLHIAMHGVRFRLPLSPLEVERGVLFISPGFDYFLRREVGPAKAQLLDVTGDSLRVSVMTVKQTLAGPLGPVTHEISAFDLGDWFRTKSVRQNDSVLVTIEDWETGRFRLEHERVANRRHQEIERKNKELADVLFDMLEAAPDERLFGHRVILTAYARLSDPRGYPGDHWHVVLQQDGRMMWDGLTICYSDSPTAIGRILLPEEEEMPDEEPYTPAQARQVYRFKAAFRHRPNLWRAIEIQGEQTLGDFDDILRDAFNHDPGDHLSGFWKRIRRGKGERFREVEIGDINPFEGGGAADLHLAGLGLKPGDELKYVYDFGDWIEHLLTLEAIIEPEGEVEYPRIADQNKPNHKYCLSCQNQGRKTVATWICIECSNEEQKQVIVCEDCLSAEHEDHYSEEMVY